MGTVSQDGVTFTWTGSEPSGNFVDGPAYVVKASGSISVDEPTPLETVDLGAVVHGAQLNPIYAGIDRQGYCEHSTDYDAAYKQSTWPLSMSPGDNLVKANSRTTTNGEAPGTWNSSERRRGVNVDTSTLCVVATAPDSETFAPPVCTGNAGALPFKQTRYADLDAAVAALPNWDVSSFSAEVPTFNDVTLSIDYWAPLYGQLPGAASGSGYQSALPFYWTATGSNYGRDGIRATDAAGLLLISNAITAAEKKQLLTRMISLGAQWHEGLKAGGVVLGGNGAHHQFGFLPMMFYLYYTQKNFDDMLTYTPNHQLAQTFLLTQSHMDNELTFFHSNSNWSASTRARQITAVSGNDITYEAGLPGDDVNIRMEGAVMVRQSDGARRLVTATPNSGISTVASQPSPAFAVGDVICFDYDVTGGYQVGQGHWGIGTSQAVKNWGTFVIGTDASYRNLQFWTGGLIVCEAMGWTGFNGYGAFKAYVEACNNYPAQVPDNSPWATHHQPFAGKDFSENFWNTHYSSMTGSPPALPVLPSGSVSATVTVP